MKHGRSLVVVAFALLVLAGAALAQDSSEAPQPTAEYEALGVWIGSWDGEGELKPGPFGPGGTMKWTEDCTWFAGGKFHVVCESEGTGPMGPMKGLGIVGYDAAKKAYTHYGVDSSGWAGYAEGGRSGDTWTFTSTETIEGKTYQSRFSMEMGSPTAMTFKWDMSEDGKTWTTMMDGTSKKK